MTDVINPNLPRGVEVIVEVVVENPKEQILLTKSPKWENTWTIPGGHIEPGETILEAAVRECKEETGLICEARAMFKFGEIINPPRFQRKAHFIYFTAHCLSSGEGTKVDQKEMTDYLWVNPNDALKMTNISVFGDTIRDFIEYKKTLRLAKTT